MDFVDGPQESQKYGRKGFSIEMRLDGDPHYVGVISDTHGLLRPAAEKALKGVELIIHAGDVGGAEVLKALNRIAPVAAVRGNMDRGDWAQKLPVQEIVKIGESLVYVIHDVHEIDLNPAAAGFRTVISGHSHRPSVVEQKGVLYLNPGSAGPRRFKLPVSLAVLTVNGQQLEVKLVELEK